MPKRPPPRFTSIQGGRAAEAQPAIRSLRDRLVDDQKPFAREQLLKSLGREPTEAEVQEFAAARSAGGKGKGFRGKEPGDKGPADAG